MSTWEPFTQHARRAIVGAQAAAQEFGHDFIDAEHIFIGVARESSSAASEAISALGVTEETLVRGVKRVLPPGEASGDTEMTFRPRAKGVIERAFVEARNLQNNFVGSEHLLLGYLGSQESAGALLHELNIERDGLRDAILQRVKRGPAPVSATTDKGLDAAYALTAGVKLPSARELWDALSRSIHNTNAREAVAYALLVAREQEWSASDLHDAVVELTKRQFPPET